MDDILTFRVKKPKYHKKKHTPNKNQLNADMVYITRVISRGDFNPENKSHVIKARVAKYKGIIDDEYNILKEEYLLCKTKKQ